MARRNICGIYSVLNPAGKIYIGQSRNVAKRWVDYKSIQKSNSGQPKLYNSFLKYGVENHEFKLIEECEFDQLNIRERHWQDFYDCTNRHKGLNCVLTDTDEKPRVISDEYRANLSASAKKRMAILVKDPDFMLKMKESGLKKKGKKMPPFTDEHREKIRLSNIKSGRFKGENNPNYKNGKPGKLNPMWGRTQSESTRRLISEKAKGRTMTEENKIKMSDRHSRGNNYKAKLVLNMETGIYYDCGQDAWEATTKFAYSTFRSKLNGSLKTPTSFRYV